MNCRDVAELLPLFLDEELAPDEMNKVATHLTTCSSCQQTLAEYRREQQILRSLPPVAPPLNWRAELMERVRNCKPQRRPSALKFLVPRLGSLAAALLVVLLVTNLYVFPTYVLDTYQEPPREMRMTSTGQQEVIFGAPVEPDDAPDGSPESSLEDGDSQMIAGFMSLKTADDLTKQDTALSLAAFSANELQRRWWLWSSSLCMVIWLAGAGYYYYHYRRRLHEQTD